MFVGVLYVSLNKKNKRRLENKTWLPHFFCTQQFQEQFKEHKIKQLKSGTGYLLNQLQ